MPAIKASQLDFDALFAEDAEVNSAAESVDEWVGNRKPRKPVCGVPKTDKRSIERYVGEARRCAKSGDWNGCTAHWIVALYMVCHERVYGELPLELGPEAFTLAVQTVKTQCQLRFGGSFTEMVEFMRWSWDRERNSIEYQQRRAQETGNPVRRGRRIGWRLQWNDSMVTDYRVAIR